MTLDLLRLSDSEVQRMLTRYCTAFGTVRFVEIRRLTGVANCNLAVVEMANRNDAIRTAEALGEVDIGSTVLIKLEQEEKSIPAFLKRQ
jgi:hypothetical protein